MVHACPAVASKPDCPLSSKRDPCSYRRRAIWKIIDLSAQDGVLHDVPARPSEIIESYLFFVMLGFLIVFERRIQELEVAERAAPK
jgi:hypothetical protein